MDTKIKETQKEFLDALKAIPVSNDAVNICDVYVVGYNAGKLAGQQKGA